MDLSTDSAQAPDLSAPAVSPAPVTVTDSAFARLSDIRSSEGAEKMLRVAVLGGGCSGFQYEFSLVDAAESDDTAFEKDGSTVLIDSVSLPLLAGSVVDFTRELIGARFFVQNPNASSTCGCGISFSM